MPPYSIMSPCTTDIDDARSKYVSDTINDLDSLQEAYDICTYLKENDQLLSKEDKDELTDVARNIIFSNIATMSREDIATIHTDYKKLIK